MTAKCWPLAHLPTTHIGVIMFRLRTGGLLASLLFLLAACGSDDVATTLVTSPSGDAP